jgi:hypothetical protein
MLMQAHGASAYSDKNTDGWQSTSSRRGGGGHAGAKVGAKANPILSDSHVAVLQHLHTHTHTNGRPRLLAGE